MFIFAHVGITVGAAALVSGAVRGCRRLIQPVSDCPVTKSTKTSKSVKTSIREITGLKPLAEFLDIRLMMVGSLFPDIIDKPLVFIGFGDGRSITHTLIITLIVLLIGLLLMVKHKKTWILAIAIGMTSHLVLDSMWLTPQVFLWPIYGWQFPGLEQPFGLFQFNLWWSTLTTNVTVDLTEGIGAVILIGLTLILAGPKKLVLFITKGKI